MSELAILRKQAGYTQETAAEALGTDRSTVAKWETGGAHPRTDKLVKLAKLYGCTVDALMGAMALKDA